MSRALVNLVLFFAVCVVVLTGLLAFVKPFSITIISLHAIFGFCFALAAIWHIKDNFTKLSRYLRTRQAMVCAVIAVGLAVAIQMQVAPVRALMRWSANTGPYWDYKRRDWQQAKYEFESKQAQNVDGISNATPNNSFDPADYLLAADQHYSVMLEINAPRDSSEHYPDVDRRKTTEP